MAPLVLALICSSAAGEKLAKAKQQAAALDFTAALGTAREAMEQGDAEPNETAAIHAFTGELAAALGDRELARGEFARALNLNPVLDLPGASPRIKEPLSEARRQVGGKALGVSAASTRASDGAVSTTVTWTGDLYSLASAGRVYVERGGRWVAVDDARLWRCGDPCRYWAAVVDRHGNQLARTGGPQTPFEMAPLDSPVTAVTPAAQPAPVQVVEGRPWFQRAGPYLTLLAAAAAGLAVFFGVQYQAEQSRLTDVEAHRSEHLMSEAIALDSARRRDRLLMFGAIAAAGAAGVVAVFTW